MDISVCITVKNEEKTVSDLIMALVTQTRKPDEIVITDGGSTDRTVSIIKHYQKKYKIIQLIEEKGSRSHGRNLAVSKCSGEIIALTDAGCVPKNDWIEKLCKPFSKPQIEVVAGFYNMKAENKFQSALRLFIGVLPKNFNKNFLPSARSLALRRLTFERVSGFPEHLEGTAEDSLFVINLLRQGVKIHRAKNARVDWEIPGNLRDAFQKFYIYALGDVRSKVWIHPVHGLMSHNVKTVLKMFRLAFFLYLLILGYSNLAFLILFFVVLTAYLSWAYFKVYRQFKDIKVGFWGAVIQIVSDVAVSWGFLNGLAT